MTFVVEPSAFNGYSGQIGRAADDATSINRYLDGYAISGGWNGAFIALVGEPPRTR